MPRRKGFKLRLKDKTTKTIIGLLVILAGGLSFLSFFGQVGLAKELKNLLFSAFGWITFAVPLAIVFGGVLLTNLKIKYITPNRIVGFWGFLTSILTLSASFNPGATGVVGASIWDFSAAILSSAGAFFVFFILTTVSLVVFFNASLEQITESSGKVWGVVIGGLGKFFARIEKPPQAARQLPFETKSHEDHTEGDITPAVVSNLPGSDKVWEYPPIDILSESTGSKAERGDIKQNAEIIEKTLESFGITAKVAEVNMGPAVTQYSLEIAVGTRLTKITSLANDIALALAAPTGTVRIEAPIPGKSQVGIEVPNIRPEIVSLRSILTSSAMQKSKNKLTLALGQNVSGEPVVDNIGRMPHMLIAGSTGSGKSVAINAFISTFLFRTTPAEVKLILVDPKRVELSQWNGIPHLLSPVIIEPEKVLSALKWAISEMDRRYKLFAEVNARNIDQYNEMSGFQALPYIVIIIDELADIMLFAPVEVEDSITRLAQMSRATGIHMILATQRPSVDVITGLIKANIPCRASFNVTSQIDSRVIIDQVGAEKLLGKGDMLYVPPDASKPKRVQGVYVNETEINKLIEVLKKSGVEPQYTEEVTSMPLSKLSGKGGSLSSGDRDELFGEAVNVVVQYDRASASLLQRRLKVGYARAARLLDELEAAGVVGVADGSKARDVLVKDPARILSPSEEK